MEFAPHAACHNDIGPRGLSVTPPWSISVAKGSLTAAMLALAVETARAMWGRGAARRMSRKGLSQRPPRRPAPSDFDRPFAPLSVVLLGLVRAFRGAVRTKLHCYDCRECAPALGIHP